MVFNDVKTKAVETLANMFNVETENEKDGKTITINDVFHCRTNKMLVDIECKQLFIERYTDCGVIITGTIAIEDVKSMYYIDDTYNIVSLDNIEF